ncbi:hypothetical protein PF004_g29786 [Phytophthora fragariae]|uniref:Uncharacterized protein n=1 Tax=Phytophthora fragariae TaxID=53985 RepID=A0A6G0MDU4_9STRA|nr:hypothetical protein PF004_g29786 [Phytophthora fragariae]
MAADDCGSPRPHAGATEDTPKLQGDLAGKMSVYDVVELLLSCDEMVGSAAGIPDEINTCVGISCAVSPRQLWVAVPEGVAGAAVLGVHLRDDGDWAVGRGLTKRPGLLCPQNKRIAEVGGQLPKLYLDGTTLAVLNEPTNQPIDWLNLQTTLHREDLEAGRTVPLAATSTTPWIPKSLFRKENVWFLVMEKRKEWDLKSKSCVTT